MSRGRPIAGSTRPRENGENDRMQKGGTVKDRDDTHHRLEPQHIAANNDLNALYALPHKFIATDSVDFTSDGQRAQSQKLFSNV